LRDTVYSHLLPPKIDVNVYLDEMCQDRSEINIHRLVMQPCESRAACNAVSKVSTAARSDMQLLLKSHLANLVIVLDLTTDLFYFPADDKRVSNGAEKRMGGEFLRKIKHLEVLNCYGIVHGQHYPNWRVTGPQPAIPALFSHCSLERVTLSFDFAENNRTFQELHPTKFSWGEFVADDKARVSGEDQVLLRDSVESFLARRLRLLAAPRTTQSDGEQEKEGPDEVTLTALALGRLHRAINFQIQDMCIYDPLLAYLGQAAVAFPSFRFASREAVMENLQAIRPSGAASDWKTSGESRTILTDRITDKSQGGRSGRHPLGTSVYGTLAKEVAVADVE
jgi:hypothetical protein